MGPITLKHAFVPVEGERRIAGAVIAGDDDAFAQLFERHRNDVYRTALAILGRHDLALDAVQETFFKVHRGLARWREESSLRTWITRIAVRCAIDMRRRSPIEREAPLETSEPSHDPRAAFEDSLRMTRLRRLTDRLSGQGGAILRLRLFSGLSNKEVAEHLSLSEGNVRMQLSTAVRRLREML